MPDLIHVREQPTSTNLPVPESLRETEPIPSLAKSTGPSEIILVEYPHQRIPDLHLGERLMAPSAPSPVINVHVTVPPEPDREQQKSEVVYRYIPVEDRKQKTKQPEVHSSKPELPNIPKSEVVPPVSELPKRRKPELPIVPKSEVQPEEKSSEIDSGSEEKSSDQKQKPEVKKVSPEVPKTAHPERKSEEKSSSGNSEPEEKSSEFKRKKLKIYNGRGRRHNTAQIDEILDWYIQYGELPVYVSDRQRYSYKHHVKLPERRQYLEQAGLISSSVPRTQRRRKNGVSDRRREKA